MSRFTTQTLRYFMEDFNTAKDRNASTCHMHQMAVNWSCGWSPEVLKPIMRFTLPFAGSGFGVPYLLEDFLDQDLLDRFMPVIAIKCILQEFKGKGLVNAIRIPKDSIRMSRCARKLKQYILGGEMKEEIEKAANDILDLNTCEIDDVSVLRYVRVGDPRQYLRPLQNNEEDERKLLEHALTFDRDEDYDQSRFFGKGIGYWYKRTGASLGGGIKRGYHQQKKHLHAEWSYFWTMWWHPPPPASVHIPPCLPSRWDLVNRKYDATDKRYSGFAEDEPLGSPVFPAVAYTLNEPGSFSGALRGTLFGKEGTIVVGLARENPNPLRIFGTKGLVTAFDPSCCGKPRPDYIWALSAARAAYNSQEADYRRRNAVESKLKDPSYRIDCVQPSKRMYRWNLREADWDAMFVPVRHANSSALRGAFLPASGSILEEVMTDRSGWKKKKGDKWVSADLMWSDIRAPGGFDGSGALKWSEMDRARDFPAQQRWV